MNHAPDPVPSLHGDCLHGRQQQSPDRSATTRLDLDEMIGSLAGLTYDNSHLVVYIRRPSQRSRSDQEITKDSDVP